MSTVPQQQQAAAAATAMTCMNNTSALNTDFPPAKLSKIGKICTIGPASRSVPMLEGMMFAEMIMKCNKIMKPVVCGDQITVTLPQTPPPAEDDDDIMMAVGEVKSILGLTEEKALVLRRVLNRILIDDPVIIVQVRPTWRPPQNVNVNVEGVLDSIATFEMAPNQRRDTGDGVKGFIFHFRDLNEVARCKRYMRYNHPYCFGVSNETIGLYPPNVARMILAVNNVFADVAIVYKTNATIDDASVYPFFTG